MGIFGKCFYKNIMLAGIYTIGHYNGGATEHRHLYYLLTHPHAVPNLFNFCGT